MCTEVFQPTGELPILMKLYAVLPALKPAAEDFRIFWDNAYGVHHLYEDKQDHLMEILAECAREPEIRIWFINLHPRLRSASRVPALQRSLHPTDNLEDIRKAVKDSDNRTRQGKSAASCSIL